MHQQTRVQGPRQERQWRWQNKTKVEDVKGARTIESGVKVKRSAAEVEATAEAMMVCSTRSVSKTKGNEQTTIKRSVEVQVQRVEGILICFAWNDQSGHLQLSLTRHL